MTPDDAAQKWIDANPDKVDAWLRAPASNTDPMSSTYGPRSRRHRLLGARRDRGHRVCTRPS